MGPWAVTTFTDRYHSVFVYPGHWWVCQSDGDVREEIRTHDNMERNLRQSSMFQHHVICAI